MQTACWFADIITYTAVNNDRYDLATCIHIDVISALRTFL